MFHVRYKILNTCHSTAFHQQFVVLVVVAVDQCLPLRRHPVEGIIFTTNFLTGLRIDCEYFYNISEHSMKDLSRRICTDVHCRVTVRNQCDSYKLIDHDSCCVT